jgi:predicted CXXCH cytochrome family protein
MRLRTARRLALVAALTLVCAMALAGTAFAYDEPKYAPEDHGAPGSCNACHRGESGTNASCGACHVVHASSSPNAVSGKGPHGFYSTTSDRCPVCHTIHDAGGGKLLASTSVSGSCFTCHDGTGGKGVYGTIKMRTGAEPAAAHRIETATIVPGGNASTGEASTMAFKGPDGTLTCDDCHSPHDQNTVAAFRVERWRTSGANSLGGQFGKMTPGLSYRGALTNRLLRKNPGGSVETVNEYGADWCAACHKGRMSGGLVSNHPVDRVGGSVTATNTYSNVARLASDGPTGLTATGTLSGTNRGYLMPFPRTPQQGDHKPICQQCHEDARNVGALGATGTTATAAPFSITATDGNVPADNPRFQNFPHETTNRGLLVETDDDLCLNCHPPTQLP